MLPFACLKMVIWWLERPGRQGRALTLGLMGQPSLDPSQWRGSAPRGKPDTVLVSSLGEPRSSDSPAGSSTQISFSKLYQDSVVLRRPLQGHWTPHPRLRVRGNYSPINPRKIWAFLAVSKLYSKQSNTSPTSILSEKLSCYFPH